MKFEDCKVKYAVIDENGDKANSCSSSYDSYDEAYTAAIECVEEEYEEAVFVAKTLAYVGPPKVKAEIHQFFDLETEEKKAHMPPSHVPPHDIDTTQLRDAGPLTNENYRGCTNIGDV